MNIKAELIDVTVDWKSRRTRLTLEAKQPLDPAAAEKMKDVDLRLRLCKWREHRSLDANAYYWVLITKLADVLGYSLSAMHNLMLRRYGCPDMYDGKLAFVVLPDCDETDRKVLEAETYHLKPTAQVKAGNDGKNYRTFVLMRGSSTYDSKEFSTLVNGLVDQCKEVGIDTATPEEIERMMALYEHKHSSAR